MYHQIASLSIYIIVTTGKHFLSYSALKSTYYYVTIMSE